MAWDPDKENPPSGPLQPHERVQARRVMKWYENRALLYKTLGLWWKWLITVPPVAVAAWGLWQFILTRGN